MIDREAYRPSRCPICDAGEHERHRVDRHVAQAYHYANVFETPFRSKDRCASCGEVWPCPTIQRYGPPPQGDNWLDGAR